MSAEQQYPQQDLAVGNPRKNTFDYWLISTFLGAVLVILSVFVPFYGMSINFSKLGNDFGASLYGSDMSEHLTLFQINATLAWILLVGAVVIGILASLQQRLAALIITILESILAAYVMFHVQSTIHQQLNSLYAAAGDYEGLGSHVVSNYVHIGFSVGGWFLIIGVMLMLIGVIISFYHEQNAQRLNIVSQPLEQTQVADEQPNGWKFGVPSEQTPAQEQEDAERLANDGWQFGVPESEPVARTSQMPATIAHSETTDEPHISSVEESDLSIPTTAQMQALPVQETQVVVEEDAKVIEQPEDSVQVVESVQTPAERADEDNQGIQLQQEIKTDRPSTAQ